MDKVDKVDEIDKVDKVDEVYDAYYYSHGCGRPYQRDDHWLAFFGLIADRIVEETAPRSALDAGCAMGFLVEQLRARDVEAFGIDISEYAISQAHPDIQPFCQVGSIAEPFPRTYDLIVCIEVLEHMSQAEAERAIANFCKHADDILFSSTPFDYKEATHFNVQPPEYWAAQFARYGFYRDVDFDASFITAHAMRLRRRQTPVHHLVRDYERRFWLLWKENTDLRELVQDMRNQLSFRDQHIDIYKQELQGHQQYIQVLERQRQALSAELGAELHVVNIQLGEQMAITQGLGSLLAEKDRMLKETERHAKELDALLTQKNEHIVYLEQLIRQIQSGRVMKTLRGAEEALQVLRRDGLTAAARHAYTARRARPLPIVDAPQPAAPADAYYAWIGENEPGQDDLARQRQSAQRFAYRPLISIITPVYNSPPAVLRAAIESVRSQTYDSWQLCLVDGGSNVPGVRETLSAFMEHDRRIQVTFLDANLGISGNSNQALGMAQGEFVVLLDHDDLLAPNLLYEVVKLLNQDHAADIIYYDEDKVSEDGTHRRDPWFKPGRWSPDLLLSTNYLMHSVIRRTLLLEANGFDSAMDGAQDWDLSLRLTSKPRQIRHIPRVLYHWRQMPGSAARDANAKPWAIPAQERCVAAQLERMDVVGAQVVFPSLGRVRVLWPSTGMKVSIIIPTKDKVELLRDCLSSIFAQTSYPDYEIILVDTGSTADETRSYYAELAAEPRVRIIEYRGTFNYSLANNLGVQHASGELLLFLNNDTAALDPDWLDELAGWAARPEVGVVGCKLLRPDGTIQHAGIIMGLAGHGSHIFEGEREGHYGPFGSSEWYRDYMAVTGACMAMRREVFEEIGGFDPAYQVGYGDIDICLRAGAASYRVVYTPFARLMHHEGGTRGFNLPPSDVLRASMRMLPIIQAGDPFFSPNLSSGERRPAFAQPGEPTPEERLFGILRSFGLVEPYSEVVPEEIASDKASGPRLAAAESRQIHELAELLDEQEPPAAEQPAASGSLLAGDDARDGRRASRLAFVTHDLSLSGAPLILCKLAVYLAQHGRSVTVYSPIGGPLKYLYDQANIDVVIEPALLDDGRAAYMLLQGYDTILVNTILSWRAVYAAKAAEIPCLWWIHESQFGQKMAIDNVAVAGAFAATDAVIFPSAATAALYTQFAREGLFRPIHYGLDLDPSLPYQEAFPRQRGKFYVVNIASIEPRKGQDTLLRAIAALPAEVRGAMEFYLVGRVLDWPFYSDLLKAARRMTNVHLVGAVSHDRVVAHLRDADVFVFASRDEALPIAVLEAMCYGKGIVTTRAGGVAEAIIDGTNGFVVEVGDHQALAQRLQQLYEDRELLGRLGASASASYQENLTIARFGEDFIREIEEVANRADR